LVKRHKSTKWSDKFIDLNHFEMNLHQNIRKRACVYVLILHNFYQLLRTINYLLSSSYIHVAHYLASMFTFLLLVKKHTKYEIFERKD